MAMESIMAMEEPLIDPEKDAPKTDDEILSSVREELKQKGTMAVGALCKSALEHASQGITQTDEKILQVTELLFKQADKEKEEKRQETFRKCRNMITDTKNDIIAWGQSNRLMAVLLVVGLGGTIFKGKTMCLFLKGQAQGFIDWGNDPSTTSGMRFCGFCWLMTVRLFVSTLVPPTSPAFSIILQAATPESEKFTAMPFFLLSAAVAGIVPYLFDKILQLMTGCKHDFLYTIAAKKFADNWPLTCWTYPTMLKAFRTAGGGKEGASFAVIMAHAAPFMGAQTTQIQRYFLPHPLDVVISQPFGMSEDLVTMALAESASNALLASDYLTVILGLFNLLFWFIFAQSGQPSSLLGFICLVLNLGVGNVCAMIVGKVPAKIGLAVVFVQFIIQLLIVPFISSVIYRENKQVSIDKEKAEKANEELEKQKAALEDKKKELEQSNRDLATKIDAEHTRLVQAQANREKTEKDLSEKQLQLRQTMRDLEEKQASLVEVQRQKKEVESQETSFQMYQYYLWKRLESRRVSFMDQVEFLAKFTSSQRSQFSEELHKEIKALAISHA